MFLAVTKNAGFGLERPDVEIPRRHKGPSMAMMIGIFTFSERGSRVYLERQLIKQLVLPVPAQDVVQIERRGYVAVRVARALVPGGAGGGGAARRWETGR